jgi:hypothetical protein
MYRIPNPLEVFYGRGEAAAAISLFGSGSATSSGFGAASSTGFGHSNNNNNNNNNNTCFGGQPAEASSPFGSASASSTGFGWQSNNNNRGFGGRPVAASSPFRAAPAPATGRLFGCAPAVGAPAQAHRASTGFGWQSNNNTNSPSYDRRHKLLDAGTIPEVSNFFSIDRYYEASDKIFQTFQMSYESQHLHNAYVFGRQYCSFCMDGITKHDYYRAKQFEHRRNQSSKRVSDVLTKLERVRKLMDVQEVERKQKFGECQSNKGNDCPLKMLANDDLVFLAERIFLQQETFCSEAKCRRVDIGYHYTKPEYLKRIRTDGLLNQKERSTKQISSSYNGSRYGEGIYTANDAQSFSDYGSVGLLVLRLKGESMDANEAGRGYDNGNDSITSKKRPSLVVLKDCSQCLPIVQFPTEEFSTNQEGLARLRLFERKLQCLVENYFHRNENTRLKSRADRVAKYKRAKHIFAPQVLDYEAPANFNEVDPSALCIDAGVHCLDIEDECPICLYTYNFTSKKVALKSCGHEFHKDCAILMLATSRLCPICRSPQNIIRGKMPSGKMTVKIYRSKHCEGFENSGTIVIDYEIFAGTQKAYHEQHGQRHSNTSRTAFIPHTLEGISLLHRLQEAFRRGLTFTVGTSLTSGEQNQVVWSSIHHKTKLKGGTTNQGYSYPDQNYIKRCNHELDTLGVP